MVPRALADRISLGSPMAVRRRRCLALLLAFSLGCVSEDAARKSPAWQTLKFDAEPGRDRVLLDVAIVQRPLDDPFLASEIWAGADEMILPMERRELVELNGFRVGLLVGFPPEKLIQLMKSERSRVERKGRSAPAGATIEQFIREAAADCECELRCSAKKERVKLERPKFAIDLTTTVLDDDRIRLRLDPRAEVGDATMRFKPLPEESKWAMEVKRATRTVPGLAFELDMAPNQILIVGPRADQPDSLGHHTFVDESSTPPTQRLLILRQIRNR